VRSKLGPRMRPAAYELARQAWVSSRGDIEFAKRLFQSNERVCKFSMALILAMLDFAIWLWLKWQKNKVTEPSVVMCAEEMAFFGSDDDE
jgi:hypothetical protein